MPIDLIGRLARRVAPFVARRPSQKRRKGLRWAAQNERKKATKNEPKKGSMKRQLECLCPEWTIVIGPGRHHHRLTLKDRQQWRQVEREANGGFGTQQLHMPSNRQAGHGPRVSLAFFQSAPSCERIVSASSSLTPSIDSIQAIDGSVVLNPFVSAIFFQGFLISASS